MLNPAARNISDDPNHKNYCNNDNIFPDYLPNVWVNQTTKATHPIKTNLVRIYNKLSAINNTHTQPALPFNQVEVEVDTTTGVSNITDIFNMLPESFRKRAKSIEIKSSGLTISINLED